MRMKRAVFSTLVGAGFFIVVAGAAYAWVEDRVNDKATEIASLVEDVIEAKNDPDEVSRMTTLPKYNSFALIWILDSGYAAERGDSKALSNSIAGGAYHTDDYELFTFMQAVDDHVNGLSPSEKKTYIEVGALELFIHLDMPSEFVGAWNECRQRLAGRYESWSANWALISDMAFENTEVFCPSLKQLAQEFAEI